MAETPESRTPENRGAVIICDHLDQMVGDKWAIIGTYNQIECHQPHFRHTINAYVRAVCETPGLHRLSLRMVLMNLSSTLPALGRMEQLIDVKNPNAIIEVGFITELNFPCPRSWDSLAPGRGLRVKLKLWAKIDDSDLASAPLDIIFVKPQGIPHGSSGAPEDGTEPA